MAQRKRRRSPRITKITGRIAKQQQRESAISLAGQIALYVLNNPEAMRGVGMVLEMAGRAMQRSADSEKTTPVAPDGASDLSAFRERKKEPSDGKENL